MSSAVFIIGPAGTGKTTFCQNITAYFNQLDRKVCKFNLDPAITFGEYHFSIHEKWQIDTIMQQYNLGPNGGMIKCLELCANDPDWLDEKINGYGGDEIMFIDCPGQIEIYIHDDSMLKIIDKFISFNYSICCIYLLDSTFIQDNTNNNMKLNSALLNSLSAMYQLSVPFINIFTKMDLLPLHTRELQFENVCDNGEDEGSINTSNNKFNIVIDEIIRMYASQCLLPFDQTNESDYYVVCNYIDRMLGKDD